MSSTKTVHDMSLLGGHPALDFVNTVDCRLGHRGRDYLGTYADLLGFAGRTGLVDPQAARTLAALAEAAPDDADAALKRARALREAIFALCLAEIEEGAAAEADLRLFDDAVRRANAQRRLARSAQGLHWTWRAGGDLDGITHRIAAAACALLVDQAGNRRVVRQCPGRDCGWVFLDTSRGGRRRWCSDGICGTRERVGRFRAG